MKVSCFLPCRKGSERVPRKNIKPFVSYDHGLVELKLRQLSKVELIENIVLSTNDEEIIDFAKELGIDNLVIHKRIDSLSSSATSTDALVAHALDLLPENHILWTHVTSPFVNAQDYSEIIEAYFKSLDSGFDSIMTTSLIHGFLWDENGAMNYDREKEKWPRTQTLSPIHEVNSAAFISHSENYKRYDDRIGRKPFLLPMPKLKSFDVDWPEDFILAEIIASSGVVSL
ncbi:acylneuraminate cytidylyltransferase [Pseudomonas sp. FFUP_PS_473]|uniref:acylneuraminate cytidylyltransferase family protein n=1 Tax=Pseudomonas sp. FFUP_PS_473 TaxID=2060418 RepID=UPI000C7E4A5B|nr:acylneuraminate cytidylyltransferase family protein [Pseudomonas sp. FFUP_PS_473]PLP89235.1 acylneuraminate cytidylyltransferase [Pseudomonas sp. FFUP_PS_473]